MQTNLPGIKQLLTDWYLLTLENPLYAGALVLSVWLLTVFFYSIRLYFFKRKQRVTEQEGIKLQGQLDEAEQQNKQSEEKLTAITEQMAKEQQLATEFALKTEERNQTIVENIKLLASKFDLSEQLVASDDKPKAEFVWQQQDNIQTQLTERLQAESQAKEALQVSFKQEKEHFSKQESLVEQLQKTLDLQTKKSIQFEQDLNAQKLIQQQQKNEAGQALADKLADVQVKHELEISALANELKQQKEAVDLAIKNKKTVADSVQSAAKIEAEKSENNNDIKVVETEDKGKVIEQEVTPIVVEELPEQVSIELSDKESQADIKSLFTTNKKQAEKSEPIQQKEVLATKVEESEPVEQAEPIPQVEVLVTKVAEVEPEELEQAPDYAKSKLNLSGKFKGLLGKAKKQVEQAEPIPQVEALATKVAEVEPQEPDLEPDYAKSKLNLSGKFKGLLGKAKKQVEQAEPIPQVEALAAKVAEVEPEELEQAPDYAKSKLNLSGKFKGLLGKAKKQTDKVEPEPEPEPEQQPEAIVTTSQEPDADDQESEPDYTKSNLNISSKVKKLFGKS